MDFDEYLKFIAEKIKKAQLDGQKHEVIRLCNLLKDTCDDVIDKISRETKQ